MIYGLQKDVSANPKSNVSIYIPGQTKLTAQDVFLGGPATGVNDNQLNGATRVFGQTAVKTAQALTDYTQSLPSQIRAAIGTNAGPRVDASRGVATLQRQSMEIGQAQNSVANNLARNTFNHNVAQDNFNNEYNVGNMMGSYRGTPTMAQKQNTFTNGLNVGDLMGNYNGIDTLAKKSQDIQNAQFNSSLSQDESQFGRTLSSNNYNSAADRSAASSGNGSNSAPVGGNVQSWLKEALEATGQDTSVLPYLATIVQHESSGNPKAINNWDSNAKAGHPSKGLMQTIDSTFSKYSMDGRKDIWNPVDNAIAAINYAVARYGSIGNVPGIKSLKNGGKYIGY